ncbi:MAG: flagellar type III secretion system pore protein FliP [Bacillota bacterium]|nr:flagellar type III secretion system pore protein FliP [Bacillota bacterium]
MAVRKKSKFKKRFAAASIILALQLLFLTPAFAAVINLPDDKSQSVQIIILLTILTLAPSILIMMTGFTRIIIVLSFVRNALGLQQTPPNQVMIGLALFLTFFFMYPVFTDVYNNSYKPYAEGTISQQQAIEKAKEPMRDFMLKQTYKKDLNLFLNMKKIDSVSDTKDIPLSTIIPAFIISEMKRAFEIGFLIYIPFMVIDMIVASTLMSMGMMMLPPTVISLPFKVLLFILVDGWDLTVQTLFKSFS